MCWEKKFIFNSLMQLHLNVFGESCRSLFCIKQINFYFLLLSGLRHHCHNHPRSFKTKGRNMFEASFLSPHMCLCIIAVYMMSANKPNENWKESSHVKKRRHRREIMPANYALGTWHLWRIRRRNNFCLRGSLLEKRIWIFFQLRKLVKSETSNECMLLKFAVLLRKWLCCLLVPTREGNLCTLSSV